PFQVVYPPDLDKGALRERYDVILLVDGAYGTVAAGAGGAGGPKEPNEVGGWGGPAEDRGRRGSETVAGAAAQAKKVGGGGGRQAAHQRESDGGREGTGGVGAESPRREGRGRQGAVAGARQVLRAAVGAPHEGGQLTPARVGHGRRGGRDVREQPNVPDA